MLLLLFDDNKIKMARKPGKKQKEKVKDEKEIQEKVRRIYLLNGLEGKWIST